MKVTAEDGTALPFTVHDNAIDFFAGAPGAVRVAAGDREYMYSLTLPELSDAKWKPPANAHEGHSGVRSGSCGSARRLARGSPCWARSVCWRSGCSMAASAARCDWFM